MVLKLTSVYNHKDAPQILWGIMQNRLELHQPKYINISHRKMPTRKQHLAFIRSKKNGFWYIIEDDRLFYGWVYLNQRNELGVMVYSHLRGEGAGTFGVKAIMKRHPRRQFLVNVNPKNKRSIKFFERLGFKLVQNTYGLSK